MQPFTQSNAVLFAKRTVCKYDIFRLEKFRVGPQSTRALPIMASRVSCIFYFVILPCRISNISEQYDRFRHGSGGLGTCTPMRAADISLAVCRRQPDCQAFDQCIHNSHLYDTGSIYRSQRDHSWQGKRMRMCSRAFVAQLIGFMLIASAGAHDGALYVTIDSERLATLLQAWGYRAKVVLEGESGAKRIQSAAAGVVARSLMCAHVS